MILEDEHAQLIDQQLIVLFPLLLQGESQLRNVLKLMLAEVVALSRLDGLLVISKGLELSKAVAVLERASPQFKKRH